MGMELEGRATITRRDGPHEEGSVKILLESDELILRGSVKLRIHRRSVRAAVAKGGKVTVDFTDGSLVLVLGDAAPAFVRKLLAPVKSRAEKMGIAEGIRVVTLGDTDAGFAAELEDIGAIVATRLAKAEVLIVLSVSTAAALSRINVCARALAPAGALWVVHPKGTVGLKDTDIFAAGKAAGLTYTKVARFSDTHTAEKLVIPKDKRVS
jgi:hypothetical protein